MMFKLTPIGTSGCSFVFLMAFSANDSSTGAISLQIVYRVTNYRTYRSALNLMNKLRANCEHNAGIGSDFARNGGAMSDLHNRRI